MDLLVVLLTGLACALILLLAGQAGRWQKVSPALTTAYAAAAFLYFVFLAVHTPTDELYFRMPWAPSLGLSLSLRLDALSIFFCLLVSGIGAAVFCYTSGYLQGEKRSAAFHAQMLLFMVSMLGIVTASNVLLLYFFWESSTLTSFLLIGFHRHQRQARQAALQALLVTGFGGICFLVGLVLLGNAAHSFELEHILAARAELQAHPHYIVFCALILLGTLTKSAQFPFHFWLPSAMTAPTPVSAYLHSAAMVKAGVYLLLRLNPALGGTGFWVGSLLAAGMTSALAGGLFALFEDDLKRVLAYLTICALGLMVALTGIGTETAIIAAVLYVLAHALYKAALFLSAGAVERSIGSRTISELGGLAGTLPALAAVTALAALSMAGFPPLVGFTAKEELLAAAWDHPFRAPLASATVAVGALLAAGALLIFVSPFLGRMNTRQETGSAPPLVFTLPAAVLALASLFLGLLPDALSKGVIKDAAGAASGRELAVDLQWDGVTPAFWLSGISLALGLAVFRVTSRSAETRRRWLAATERFQLLRIYSGLLFLAQTFSNLTRRVLVRQPLRFYLLFAAGICAVFMLTPLALSPLPSLPVLEMFTVTDAAACAAIFLAALMVVRAGSAIPALTALTVVGLGVAWLFADFSAPDAGITQFGVEVLASLMMVAALYRIPRREALDPEPAVRSRDWAVALLFGTAFAALSFITLNSATGRRASDELVRAVADQGAGTNIVNIILTDVRALDTLGEISVLAASALGAYLLLTARSEVRP